MSCLTLFSNLLAQEKLLRSSYEDTLKVAGHTHQMGKRSLVLLNLYLESEKKLKFAYAISHLTLAIERSMTAPRIEKAFKAVFMKKYAEAWTEWGEGLAKINQEMVKRFYFAYSITDKLLSQGQGIKELERASGPWDDLLKDIDLILPLMEKVLLARNNDTKISEKDHDEIFESFVRWEHQYFIQPRMEKNFEKLPRMLQYVINNVPGKIIEPAISLFFKARTSYSLSCLDDEKFRTQNFMNYEHRMGQALQFHRALKKIKYDPYITCFRGRYRDRRFEGEPYYVTRFPARFYFKPEDFAKTYTKMLLNKEDQDSTQYWLNEQYKDLPVSEFAIVPTAKIKMSHADKVNLRMDANPVQRNHYINSAYLEIANQLSACLETTGELGNWYHFARWASKSGGHIIDGSKYDGLKQYKKIGMHFADYMDWMKIQEQENIVARANDLIAIEMIPLGRKFVSLFCDQKVKQYKAFKKLLHQDTQSERIVDKAFEQYFMAIKENDRKLKIERIALASTLQVMGEQMRINENLYSAFDYDVRVGLIRKFYKFQSTKNGTLAVGTEKQLHIKLTEDVTIDGIHPDLEKITLKDYIKLHSDYDLAYNYSGLSYVQETRVRDWANLEGRLKFLIALFRVTLHKEELIQAH